MDELETVRAVFEEGWSQQNFEPIKSAFVEDFRFHVGGTTQAMSLDDLRETVRRWHIGFPDLRFDVESVVASGDRAAVHASLRGTHRGPWGGLEATGRSISVEHMFFFRFEDGRIAEVWELLDRSELRRQLVDG